MNGKKKYCGYNFAGCICQPLFRYAFRRVSAEVLQQGSVSNAQRVLPDACGRTHSR